MAYQAFLNNRTHKPSLQNWFFPSLSTTTVTNTSSSSSIPPSPDDVESALTSSDSGTDSNSTFSFSTPTGSFGTDSLEVDLPPTMSFGDLGGFKSYHEEMENKDAINVITNGAWDSPSSPTSAQSYPNSVNSQTNQLANNTSTTTTTSHITSGANLPPSHMMQKFDYNSYSYGSNVAVVSRSGEPNTNTIPASSFVSTPTPSTSVLPLSASSASSTPTPPASASTFQFSFRMTPPQANIPAQGQAYNNKGHRMATHSPARTPSANNNNSTTSSPSESTSKPMTLQFNTRNGQSVLSLSTPAREAAALREKMRKEKQERNVGGGGEGVGYRANGGAAIGSKGREPNSREEQWTWRNIKPAPPHPSSSSSMNPAPPTVTVPVASLSSEPQSSTFESTSSRPGQSSLVHPPPQVKSPGFQKYQNAYVPYDMYEELIHGTIESAKVVQHEYQQQQQQQPDQQQGPLGMGEDMGRMAALERARMQASLQAQIQKQAQAHTRDPSQSSEGQGQPHNANPGQGSTPDLQHFQSRFQIGNPYPSTTSTPTSIPTFSPGPNSDTNANLATMAMSGSQHQLQQQLGVPYSGKQMVVQENQHMVGGEGWEQQQGQQNHSLSASTSQHQYHGSQNGQMMQSASSHFRPHHQHHPLSLPSQSVPPPPAPLTLFRRPNGACTRCKRMKMKCVVPSLPNGTVGGLHVIPEAEVDMNVGSSPNALPPSLACTRCAAANQPCIVEGRKPRTPSQREALLASIRQKEAIIATLLAPYQPSEHNANIVLNGAKVIEALDKGKEKAEDEESTASTHNMAEAPGGNGSAIGPVERAALLANDKGVSTKDGRLGFGKNKFNLRKRSDTAGGGGSTQNANANANSSDEDSVSSDNSDFEDSEEDDIWDGEVERGLNGSVFTKAAFGGDSTETRNTTPAQSFEEGSSELEQGQTPGSTSTRAGSHLQQSKPGRRPQTRSSLESQLMMHLHTLPPLDTPLGTIARLSLEGLGEKLRSKSKSDSGQERVNVKVEGGTESVPPLVGQKRRREVGDAGDQERDGVMEDEEEREDGDAVTESDDGNDLDAEEDNAERRRALADPQSITLTDAQTLSLSSLVITESDGPSHRAYFAPGLVSNLPLRRIINARAPPPPILSSGLVTWEECAALFDIFYEYVHAYCSVLDPVLHTVQTVYERDPFLFTVVLAVSSRYYTARPGLYKVAMHYAKAAAATAFVNGIKSVEMVQAYLIMCTYCLPARRWEEDRSWFYGGLAFRIATDLNLDKSFDDYVVGTKMNSLTGPTNSLSERQEREKLNRMRTWLNCFNVDRSSSTQWGKPNALVEGGPIRKAREWWRCSLYNHPYDLHLVAYTELLRIVSRFHEQVYSDPMSKTGLNKNANFQKITEQIEADIKDWHDNTRWTYDRATTKSNPSSRASTVSPSHPSPSPAPTLSSANKRRQSISSSILSNAFSARRSPPMADLDLDPALIVRIEGVPVFENYMRLVMYSFGFEQAWRKFKARRSKSHKMDVDKNMMLTMDLDLDLDGGDMFFLKCLHSASAVVRHLSDVYGPSGYLKYAPDCFFVMGGFCAAFLLKMLRPAFAPLLDNTQRERVIQVVTRFVDVLDSPTASIDATHTPRLYAKFLRGAMRDVASACSADRRKALVSNGAASAVPSRGQAQTSSSSSSSTSGSSDAASGQVLSSSTSAMSGVASPFRAPSLSSSHTQTPRNDNEDCRTLNVSPNGSAGGDANHRRMGIDPTLTVSSPSKFQDNNANSGASTPSADMFISTSTTPTPTPPTRQAATSMPGSNLDLSGIGHAFGTTSSWSSLAQTQDKAPARQEFMGYPSHAHTPPQHITEHQNWPHTAIRNTTAGDLGIGLGAAVMASINPANLNMNNGAGEGYAYNDYSQPQGQGRYESYSQFQLQNLYHQNGPSSWDNQYTTQQQVASPGQFSPTVPFSSMTSIPMELSEDDFLATMHAVSSDNWNSSVLMPGYGWGPDNDEDVGMGDA